MGGQLEAGAIAAITYARKLMMAPVGVIGQAVGAALLPTLTTFYQRDARTDFDQILTTTLRATLALGLLAGGALVVLALPIVQLVFEHGRFTSENAQQVSGLLVILGLAVPGWVLQQVAVRGFYARGEMWRAMALSTVIALSVFPLYLWGSSTAGIRGLATASAVAITVNAIITLVWLRLRAGTPNLSALAETFARTLLITLLSAVTTVAALQSLDGPLGLTRSLTHFLIGGFVYTLTALIATRFIGDPPLRNTLNRLLSKLKRT